MNTPSRRLSKTAILFAGAMFLWSSWAVSPFRFALMRLRPAPPAKQLIKAAPSPEKRLESARRLGDALKDPKVLSDPDKLLSLLR